jgi:hypothetical protein
MEDKEAYINLRKALDSLRDVALAEIELIKSEGTKSKFAKSVTNNIKQVLKDIASNRRVDWKRQNPDQSKKFADHAKLLLENPSLDCPPGFIEVGGICVRI